MILLRGVHHSKNKVEHNFIRKEKEKKKSESSGRVEPVGRGRRWGDK